MLYITGTKKSVIPVATSSPPMTARPSCAFCSLPSPIPSDIGSIPIIIASAFINTGRRRVIPAASAAPTASRPTSRCPFANVTTRDVTERPETVECGSNVIAGVSPDRIATAVRAALARERNWTIPPEYLAPAVSDTVVNILLSERAA